ncbi:MULTISPECIES: DUF5685 family protein [Glycomyces]|nr:DUF5685 family protein [Glycomyces lechevalierae]MDA1384972.1 DUF5685 family protein [Glycomyces lechevalierae]
MLAPCPSRTPDDLKPRWMGHFCGLCLELRDDAGQFARLTTNYDALALSVLVEAQQGDAADSRNAGPCALRGMRRQRIATGGGPRLAATASLLLASAKIRDHVEDGDGFAAKPGARGIAGLTADRLRAKATAIGDSIGLDTAPLFAVIEGQRGIEADCGHGTPLTAVTAPTEAATAELFAHAALIGGRPENTEAFRTAGAAFGRLAHLLDAADDFEEDAERGAWNPLAATGSGIEDARSLAKGALADMKRALDSAVIVDATMMGLLLDRYARHAFTKTFGSSCSTHQQTAERRGYRERRDYRRDHRRERRSRYDDDYRYHRPEPRNFFAGLCAFTVLCCTCQMCCREEYEGPWSRRRREGCCRDCDCCDCCPCDGDCCGCGCD